MADYYHLISDAIAALDKKTSETRHAFYDRARASLANNLRKADPPLSEIFIEHERLALEDAISKVEADAIRSDGIRSIQTQSDHIDNYLRRVIAEASSAKPDAKLERERFAFWGLLIVGTVLVTVVLYSLFG
jgi:hypothetical protein